MEAPDQSASTNGLPQFEEEGLTVAARTEDGYKVGGLLYDSFAGIAGLKALDDMTIADMGQYLVSALRKFATFLREHKQTNDKHYKPDTQTQYLSNVKSVLAKRFPKATFLKKGHEDSLWYNELLGNLRVRGRAEAIKRGESVKDSTQGIRRKLLMRICEHLVKEGTQMSFCERAVLVTLYHAVGRGGEVSTCNFNLLRWDEDEEAMWTMWQQVKTGRSCDLSFHPDADCYFVCELHALGSYILTAGNGLVNKELGAPDWLFPSLVGLAEGGATSKASRIIKKLVGKVEGLLPEHAAHGLRAGSADEMAFNHLVHVICMIARGDWDWSGDCQMFGYLTNSVHVSIAGHALANWSDPRMRVSSPRIEAFVDASNQVIFEKFAYLLFFFAPADLQPKGRLIGLRNALIASLLQYFDALTADAGYDNIVVVVILKAAEESGVTITLLRQWGELVQKDFKLRNALNQKSCGSDVERAHAAICILSESMQAQQKVVQAQGQHIASL